MTDLDLYVMEFRALHVNKCKGKVAPHKAILLLSIIDLVENGHYSDCYIYLDDTLVQTFNANWAKYVSDSTHYKCNIAMPIFYMTFEGFWRLIPFDMDDDSVYDKLSTLGGLRKKFRYGMIDSELFDVLQDRSSRAKLRTVLISCFLT